MPRDGAGVYSLPGGYKATSGSTILDTQHNGPLEDIQQALTDSLPRNGAAGMAGLFSLFGDATASLHPVTYQQLLAVAKHNKGPSAPSSPAAGWMWLEDDNPSATVWSLRVYDGTDWIALGTVDTTANTFTPAIPNASITSSQLATGVANKLAQVVNTTTGALITLSGSIPYDDTIPQITEGTQVLSRSITPTSASSTLVISISLNCTPLAAAEMIAALFQDSTANALSAMSMYASGAGERVNIAFTHTMVAGTTSSTTFTVRCGPAAAVGTSGELNGSGTAARRLGGVMSSSITITEILP
jgi:hypothetical protein